MSELLGMLATDSGQLVRQELQLASFELSDRMREATGKMGVIALGGGLAHAGLLGVLAAATVGLAMFIPFWAAALILGAVFLLVGGLVVRAGIQSLRPPMPATTTANAPALTAAKDGMR